MKIKYEAVKWQREVSKIKTLKKTCKGDLKKNELFDINEFLGNGSSDYLRLYNSLASSYAQLAKWNYLDDILTNEIKKYTYLSGVAFVIAANLYKAGVRTKFNDNFTDSIVANSIESDIDYALFQLIAVDELENPYTKIEEKNLIVLMYYQKYEEAMVLLNQLPDEPDESNEIYYIDAQYLKKIYMAIINCDEKNFNEELVKRIKKYRKNMVGYSTIIDIVSVGLIKIAKRAGIQCTVDVIEIPKQFFDDACILDKNEMKLPFYDEFLEAHLL